MNVRRAADRERVLGEIERMKIDKERIGGDMGWMCACGCGQRGHDLHHALISRLRRFPELDTVENLVLVNHAEHISRKFDNVEWRKKFWQLQCKRYGLEHMEEWIENLPAKLDRGRIDFIE